MNIILHTLHIILFLPGSIILIFYLQFWYQISNILHTVALKKKRLCSSSCPVFIYPVLNSLEYGNVSRGEPRYSALQNNNSMQPAIFSGDKGIQNHYKFISHDLHMLHYLFLIRGVYNFISFGFVLFKWCHGFHRSSQPSKRLWQITTYLCSQRLYLSLYRL